MFPAWMIAAALIVGFLSFWIMYRLGRLYGAIAKGRTVGGGGGFIAKLPLFGKAGMPTGRDWYSMLNSLFAGAHAVAIIADDVMKKGTIVPLWRQGGKVFAARVFTPEGVKFVLTILDENDIICYLEGLGIPVYVVAGRWLNPLYYVGLSIHVDQEGSILTKIIEGKQTYVGIKLPSIVTQGKTTVSGADPAVLAETLVEIAEKYVIDYSQSQKVVEFAPGVYFGVSVSDPDVLRNYLALCRYNSVNATASVNELFKRADSIEKAAEQIRTTELEREKIKLEKLLYVLVFAFLFAALLLSGGAQGLLNWIGQLLGFGTPSPEHKTPAHTPPVTQAKPPPAHTGGETYGGGVSPVKQNATTTQIVTPANKTKITRPTPP